MKIKKVKAKRIAIMFFIAGAWGIGISFIFGNASNMLILFLSVLNLVLGVVFTLFYRKAKE